jgi:hypothetical protein
MQTLQRFLFMEYRQLKQTNKKKSSVVLVRKWTTLAERPHMLAKLVPTFAGRGCRGVSATNPHGHILGFLDRSRYYFFQVSPQLHSRSWVDPIPDPLLLRNAGSAGNRTRDLWICSQEFWPLDHRDDYHIKILKPSQNSLTNMSVWSSAMLISAISQMVPHILERPFASTSWIISELGWV